MSSSPYAPAAKLLNQIWEKRKGLKTVAYNRQGELTCSKSTYAQCAHVLQAKPLLDRLCEDITAKNKGLLYVLVYELLLGPNKSIRGGGALRRHLIERETELREMLKKIQETEGETVLDFQGNTIPRYVRVNTIQTSTAKVIEAMKAKGMTVYLDPHVPDVLVVPPTPESRAQLQDLVTSHHVVLQDKSSCFSALCLVHGFDHDEINGGYLDACAAPGNKTSHLAALVKQQNTKNHTIHALDKSSDRFKLLQRRMNELVGPAVKCHNLDFFEASSTNFEKIGAILLDPSCSGSGMASNHSEATRDPMFVNDRIKSLAEFQLKALKHATTAFVDVNRVVYSTCSLYAEENERVVQRFLQESPSWSLVSPKCLKSWKRRGIDLEGLSTAESNAMIRAHPDHDSCNGFFVACLEKQKRTKSSVNDTWGGVKSIFDIPLYDNQFHGKSEKSEQETTNVVAQQKETTSTVKLTTSPNKGKSVSIKKTSTKTTRSNSTNKRKEKPVVEVASPSKRAKVSIESMNDDTKNSKKRAKKVEWKQRQHQRKVERLAAKAGTRSTADTSSK